MVQRSMTARTLTEHKLIIDVTLIRMCAQTEHHMEQCLYILRTIRDDELSLASSLTLESITRKDLFLK